MSGTNDAVTKELDGMVDLLAAHLWGPESKSLWYTKKVIRNLCRQVAIDELEKLTIPFGIELHPFYAEDRNAEQRFGYAEARVTFLKAKWEAINRLKGGE